MKRLYRDKSNEMIAGVCSGIADYLDIDPTVVRLLFVLFSFAGGGGVMVYIVLWIIMPEGPELTDVVVDVKDTPAAPRKVAVEKKEPAPKTALKKAPAKKPTAASAPKKPAATKKTTSATKKAPAKKPAATKRTTRKAAPKKETGEE